MTQKIYSPWELRHEQFALHVIEYLNAHYNALYGFDSEEGDADAPVFRGYYDYINTLRLPWGCAVY